MEKISVNEFVEKYLSLNDEEKETYVDSIITRKYAPVLEKKVILDTLFKKAILKNEFEIEYLDLFLSRINVCIGILLLYTKLDLVDKNSNNFNNYDLLKEHNLFDIICNHIGEYEMEEVGIVNELIINTYLNQKNDPKYYISTNISKLSAIFSPISKAFAERLPDFFKKITDFNDELNK